MSWVPWLAMGVPLLLGILGVAWRLGGLDRSVKDLGNRIERVEDKLDGQEFRARRMR